MMSGHLRNHLLTLFEYNVNRGHLLIILSVIILIFVSCVILMLLQSPMMYCLR